MEKYKVKINKIVNESQDVKTFFLDIPEGVTFKEGAHMHIALDGYLVEDVVNKDYVRHLSISSLNEEGCISFTTRFNNMPSIFKKKLLDLKVNDTVELFKVSTRMELRRVDKDIYLISQGVGIATFRPLILSFIKDDSNIKSLTSVNINRNEEYIFKNEIDKLTHNNLTTIWLTKREQLKSFIKNIEVNEEKLFYIVGSDLFLESVISMLQIKGVKRENIVLDKKPEKCDLFFNK